VSAAAGDLRAALRDRERRIVRLLDRVALDQEAGLTLGADPPPPTPLALGAATALVAYHFGVAGGTAFVVADDTLRAVPLATTSAELARLLGRWRLNLASAADTLARGAALTALGRNARGLLAALYAALIAPVAPLLADRERLIIVPYGPAHAVPFAALHDGASFLLERHEITLAPSVAVLQLCAARPAHPAARRALVVAHSNGGRLPAVLEEARIVSSALPGEVLAEERATRAALAEAVSRHGLLHLAAHGAARLDNPAFAHVQLADGQLSAAEIFNLDLRGALVVLSACETGRYAVRGGDEPVGLARGFLYAGAKALVQSLWRVEDGATARLMARFYDALGAGERPGAS
jgi:CHAT domain-containing protein